MALDTEQYMSPGTGGNANTQGEAAMYVDDANINVELEQGRSATAGKLQYALLK